MLLFEKELEHDAELAQVKNTAAIESQSGVQTCKHGFPGLLSARCSPQC